MAEATRPEMEITGTLLGCSDLSPKISGLREGDISGNLRSSPSSRFGSAHIVAVDIGVRGAAAFLDHRANLLAVEDLPVLDDGPSGRPSVNAILFAALIRRWSPERAVVEYVSARPGEGAVGAFSFGRSRGTIEGALGACGVPIATMTPAAWKRRVGVPPGKPNKDRARSLAIGRWPHHAERFARAKDLDRAEAALIGLAFIGDRP